MELTVIAKMHSDFTTKFGLPRQSGIVDEIQGTIVFEPRYRTIDAIRGIDGFSHLWLLWGFSRNNPDSRQTLTVRPPRLGGNTRMGVFATRSPYRPNPIGLSCVQLRSIEINDDLGPILHVSGSDLADGTPIYDIKPYLPYADSHPDARCGFAGERFGYKLVCNFPTELQNAIPADKREALIGALEGDPRPAYQNDPDRIYGFEYAGFDIRFKVSNDLLTVVDIVQLKAR